MFHAAPLAKKWDHLPHGKSKPRLGADSMFALLTSGERLVPCPRASCFSSYSAKNTVYFCKINVPDIQLQ